MCKCVSEREEKARGGSVNELEGMWEGGWVGGWVGGRENIFEGVYVCELIRTNVAPFDHFSEPQFVFPQ